MSEKDVPVPDDEDAVSAHVISVRMPEGLYRQLVKDANELNMLVSECVRAIIREFYSADEDEHEDEDQDEDQDEEEESKPKRRRKRSKHLFG